MCTLHNTIWRIKLVRKSERLESAKGETAAAEANTYGTKENYSRRLANEAI